MKFDQTFTLAAAILSPITLCAPARVGAVPNTPQDARTVSQPLAGLDQHTCLSNHKYNPKDYDGWEFECFQSSDCGGGEQMGCHCIIEAVMEIDPSLGKGGLQYYNKVPKCVYIPTIEQLSGKVLHDGAEGT
ncbi:hypothetical protein TWF281_003886 [Arthrobotrys megalospora]